MKGSLIVFFNLTILTSFLLLLLFPLSLDSLFDGSFATQRDVGALLKALHHLYSAAGRDRTLALKHLRQGVPLGCLAALCGLDLGKL